MSKISRRANEKDAQHKGWSTVGDLADALGVTGLTIKRWVKSGKIPPHEAETLHGWHLWSPATVARIIDRTINRGEEHATSRI